MQPSEEHSRLYETLVNSVLAIDTDGNGKIDFEEFRRAIARLQPLSDEQTVHETFKRIDTDGSGTITLNELAVHVGFRFDATGKLIDLADATEMVDEQLLTVMQLETIANDLEAAHAAEKSTRDRKAQMELMQRKAEEEAELSRLLSAESYLQRSETRRRLSCTLPVGAILPTRHELETKYSATSTESNLLEACAIGDWKLVKDSLGDDQLNVLVCDDKGEVRT